VSGVIVLAMAVGEVFHRCDWSCIARLVGCLGVITLYVTKLPRLLDWATSRPVKRWIYARRERRWLARQPKPQRSPYRGER
jgi:hypothetical protein